MSFFLNTTVCGFSLYHILAFFLIYSCLGWCVEVVYAGMQTRAALRAKYPGAQCEVGLLQIGCTIAVHTGPYALGMGVMRRWKKQS